MCCRDCPLAQQVYLMQAIGLVLRDVDGYELVRGKLRPRHAGQLDEWITENEPVFWRKHYLDWQAGTAKLPDGFELYDPFTEQPALFEIAARFSEDFSEEGIAGFATSWGDISLSDFKRTVSTIEDWETKLRQIHRIARLLGQSLSPKVVAGRLREFLWDLEIGYVANPVHGGLQSNFVTFGLGNSLLVQATEAVANQWVLRNCPHCGSPIAAAENRTDRVFCSNSCRVQDYKKRMKKAIEMHSKGKSVRQIAAAVGSDVPTVRGWLNRKGNNHGTKTT